MAFNRQRLLGFLLLSLGVLSCSPFRTMETEITLFRWPEERFRSIKGLGVTRVEGLNEKFHRALIQRLQDCQRYETVRTLPTGVDLPNTEQDSVVTRTIVDAFPKAREDLYIDGVLIMKLLDNSWNSKSEVRPYVSYVEQRQSKWGLSSGFSLNPMSRAYARPEAFPDLKIELSSVRMFARTQTLRARATLFDFTTRAIVFDVTSQIDASLEYFSSTPPYSPDDMRQTLFEKIMSQVVADTCVGTEKAKRFLYALGDESKVDNLNYFGMQLAKKGRWEEAYDQWRKALVIQEQDPFVHNNMGVYFERQGRIDKALTEYRLAKIGRHAHRMAVRNLDLMTQTLVPTLQDDVPEERIIAVTSAGWVTLAPSAIANLPVDREYSVFRGAPMRREGAGMRTTEVGRVRIDLAAPPYVLGRVLGHLQSDSIRPGDVIFGVRDNSSTSAPETVAPTTAPEDKPVSRDPA